MRHVLNDVRIGRTVGKRVAVQRHEFRFLHIVNPCGQRSRIKGDREFVADVVQFGLLFMQVGHIRDGRDDVPRTVVADQPRFGCDAEPVGFRLVIVHDPVEHQRRFAFQRFFVLFAVLPGYRAVEFVIVLTQQELLFLLVEVVRFFVVEQVAELVVGVLYEYADRKAVDDRLQEIFQHDRFFLGRDPCRRIVDEKQHLAVFERYGTGLDVQRFVPGSGDFVTEIAGLFRFFRRSYMGNQRFRRFGKCRKVFLQTV